MKKPTIWTICSALTVLAAATTPSINAEEFTSTGDCLFDFGYINYAWGQDIWGFYIDKDGSVFTYEKGSNDSRWYPDKVEVGSFWSVTETNLESKFSNKTFLGKVDPDVLSEKTALIIPASKGAIEVTLKAVDGGITNGNAFLYDPNVERYLVINLGTGIGTFGDREEVSTSEEARSLLSWLSDIHENFVYPNRQLQIGIGSVKLLGDTMSEDNHWWWSPTFDFFNTDFFPWIYHNQMGWLFWRYDPGNGVYFYDLEDGWLWTAPDVLPYLYCFNPGEWRQVLSP